MHAVQRIHSGIESRDHGRNQASCDQLVTTRTSYDFDSAMYVGIHAYDDSHVKIARLQIEPETTSFFYTCMCWHMIRKKNETT